MAKKNDELLEQLRKILVHPLSIGEIKRELGLKTKRNITPQIRELLRRGEIVKIRGGRFGLPGNMNLVVGTVQGHQDGFGFLIPDERGEQDVYLGPRNFREGEAMHGDKAVCRVEHTKRDGRREGRVIRILERGSASVTGIFESRGQGGVLIPTQKRMVHNFRIPPGKTCRAKGGQVVTARITSYPDGYLEPQAEVEEVLGFPSDPGVDRMIIVRQYGLEEEFPTEVERAASAIKHPAQKDMKERLDLRETWIVTIDGENAKDFDDAISIKRTQSGYELGVHIADVSHYVHQETAIDREAYRRGNSTYFPDSVIPMLPFPLSNDICSLRPDVPRLTLSCLMHFSLSGEMTSYRFTPSVIKSRHRMTYTEAARIIGDLDGEADMEKAANLSVMKELCDKLHGRRMDEGSIDFDLPEPEVILDIEGEPENIIRAERNAAHRLIEEFMLSANRASALFLEKKPSIYRVHPEPDGHELENFFDFASRIGYVVPRKENVSFRLQEILEKAVGRPEEKLLNYIMLRTMKQASYAPENIGHFGLGFTHYTHFTSPIRRYPDLIVHRLIKAKLAKGTEWPSFEELAEMGRHCSETERTSESAERDVIHSLKVRFMAERVGEEFEGIISGVTAFGIFVELSDIFVEGLLRLTDLHDDYYDFHEREYSLIGKRTGRTFRLGSPIKIRLKNVDLFKKEIEFEPIDAPKTSRGGALKKRRKAVVRRGKKKR